MDCELEASGTPVDAAGTSTASKEDALAPLPSFGRPGRRKPDPRRQSVALFNAFSQTTSGRGFLSGDEIALGDEDVQIPLDKSGRLLGGVSNHSQLWVEPGIDDLLSSELPSPELGVLSQASGGAANGGPLPSSMRGLHGAESESEHAAIACGTEWSRSCSHTSTWPCLTTHLCPAPQLCTPVNST